MALPFNHLYSLQVQGQMGQVSEEQLQQHPQHPQQQQQPQQQQLPPQQQQQQQLPLQHLQQNNTVPQMYYSGQPQMMLAQAPPHQIPTQYQIPIPNVSLNQDRFSKDEPSIGFQNPPQLNQLQLQRGISPIYQDMPPILNPPSLPVPIEQHHYMGNPVGIPYFNNSGYYNFPYNLNSGSDLRDRGQDMFSSPMEMKKEPKQNNFTPIHTKKNSRPRINKLSKSEANSPRLQHNILGELSIDDLFNHFREELKIEVNGVDLSSVAYQLSMKSELECQLFDMFINRVSSSIDIFLPQEVFKKIIPHLSLYDETNMIIDSIFCLSSLMLQRSAPDKVDPSTPIKYYHQCIKSIRHYLSIPGIESDNTGIISRCLLSTNLLCIYELFFVAIDSTYVKGASSILSSILQKCNNQNQSLLRNSPFHQTCFWAMFISDLILSLKYHLPSMYSVENFWRPLDPLFYDYFDKGYQTVIKENENSLNNLLMSKESNMWFLQKSLLNFSVVNEFNNQVNVISKIDFETNKPFHDWLKLKSLLDEFERSMPMALKPSVYRPISSERIYPTVYFKDEVAAIVGLNLKLSKIALYESLISKNDINNPIVLKELSKYPSNYAKKLAKDIIGIMMTYDANLFIWPVNVHTIRQVAHYVFDEPDAFHGLEELIERILFTCNLRLQDKIFPQ